MSISPSPSILPISSPQTTSQISTPQQNNTSSSSSRLFLSRLSDSIRTSLSNRRPWSELYDRSSFSRPHSLSDATSRIRKNISYFRINYATILTLILALSLLSNPLSLLILLFLLYAWCFLYLFRPSDPPLVVFGRTFSDRETLGGLVILTIFVVFLTSIGSLLISALTVGAAIVCVHGAFRLPEDLFLDEQEPVGATTGFLSFIGRAATSAGPSV